MTLPEPASEDRLRAIADDMLFLLSQDMLDGEMDRLADKSPLEVATYFYLSSDCDVFAEALLEVLEGQIVSVTSASQGPIHRLVRLEGGEMLDAGGYQTLATLQSRYGLGDLSVAPWRHGGYSETDDIETALEIMASLPHDPFPSLPENRSPSP